MDKLIASFINSERLAKHVRFLLANGSILLIYNGIYCFMVVYLWKKMENLKNFKVEGKDLNF